MSINSASLVYPFSRSVPSVLPPACLFLVRILLLVAHLSLHRNWAAELGPRSNTDVASGRLVGYTLARRTALLVSWRKLICGRAGASGPRVAVKSVRSSGFVGQTNEAPNRAACGQERIDRDSRWASVRVRV